MREKKKMISLDIDSALALMQEIYNDIVEQKNVASQITKKMMVFMKEADDMSLIGPVIKDQQKILNDCTEKKISLVKLQSTLLKQAGGNPQEGFSKMTLSDEDKEILEKLINEGDSSDKSKRGNYTA